MLDFFGGKYKRETCRGAAQRNRCSAELLRDRQMLRHPRLRGATHSCHAAPVGLVLLNPYIYIYIYIYYYIYLP